jgi:hypothetical protein
LTNNHRILLEPAHTVLQAVRLDQQIVVEHADKVGGRGAEAAVVAHRPAEPHTALLVPVVLEHRHDVGLPQQPFLAAVRRTAVDDHDLQLPCETLLTHARNHRLQHAEAVVGPGYDRQARAGMHG